MSIDTILSRLEHVKKTGAGRWIARCPAHEDRSPSLSLRELDDGRILLHCFAGCAPHNVLAATGLEFKDLFPRDIEHLAPRGRTPFNAMDVLQCVAFEALVTCIAAENLAQGVKLTREDHDRLTLAAQRLQDAVRVVRNA